MGAFLIIAGIGVALASVLAGWGIKKSFEPPSYEWGDGSGKLSIGNIPLLVIGGIVAVALLRK